MLRRTFLSIAALLVPACTDDEARPLGWQAPPTLPDSDYPNGHPLARALPESPLKAQIEDELLVLLDNHRLTRGLPPLARDRAAEAIARGYSAHMAQEDFFSHTDPEGDTILERTVKASGAVPYVVYRENIARTVFLDSAYIFNLFLNSPIHRLALEATDTNVVGIGVAEDTVRHLYYTTMGFYYR